MQTYEIKRYECNITGYCIWPKSGILLFNLLRPLNHENLSNSKKQVLLILAKDCMLPFYSDFT